MQVKEVWKMEREKKGQTIDDKRVVRVVTFKDLSSGTVRDYMILYSYGRDLTEAQEAKLNLQSRVRPMVAKKIRDLSDQELRGDVYSRLVATAENENEMPRTPRQVNNNKSSPWFLRIAPPSLIL